MHSCFLSARLGVDLGSAFYLMWSKPFFKNGVEALSTDLRFLYFQVFYFLTPPKEWSGKLHPFFVRLSMVNLCGSLSFDCMRTAIVLMFFYAYHYSFKFR